MYLWRPNESEIEDYRMSKDIEKLKIHISLLYNNLDIVYVEYHGMTIVKEKHKFDIYELGYISRIKEI